MNYQKILSLVQANGIQEYDQGSQAIAERIDIKNGVCRALVLLWLCSKKNNQNFWAGKGSVNEGLLAESKRLSLAVDLQADYANSLQSRFAVDSASAKTLNDVGVVFNINDVTASTMAGFADTSPINQLQKIAENVLTKESRFFILSIAGKSGAHSIGIFRPYSLIGKSSDAYVFDPNIGEFMTTGADNLKQLLSTINSQGYQAISVDLNKSYVLWSFKA